MELTISGFWTALIMIFVMSIFLFAFTKSCTLYNTVCPTTVILCGLLVLLRALLPYEFELSKSIYITQFFPVLDSIIRYEVINVGGLVITIWKLLLAIWGVVLAKKMLKLIRDYIIMRRIIESCDRVDSDLLLRIEKLQEKAGIASKRITYKVSKFHGNPFIFGIIKSIIILPIDLSLWSDDELYLVLLHEWSHYKRKDGTIKMTLEVFCCAFWWLPFLERIKGKLYEAIEVRADWGVIGNMQEDQKTHYMVLLYKLLENKNNNQDGSILSNTFVSGQVSMMEKRFDFMDNGVQWGMKNVLLLTITIMLFILSYFIVLEPNYIPDDGAVICKSSCHLYERSDGTYDIYMDGIHIGAINDINIIINSSDFDNVEVRVFKEDE